MLPTRKIKINNIRPNYLTRKNNIISSLNSSLNIKKNNQIRNSKIVTSNKKMIGGDGETKEVTATAVADVNTVDAMPLADASAVDTGAGAEPPLYKAPGILASLSKYSESAISTALTTAKDMVLKELKIKPKEGESSAELFAQINKVLEDPKTKADFLDFAKNIADKGLTMIQVGKPLAQQSVDAVVEIFNEIAEKGGKSVVKIGKDVAAEIPGLGSILGFFFLCDDFVKLMQSGLAAFFQIGIKAYELKVNTDVSMKGAVNMDLARPEIKQSALEVSNTTIAELNKLVAELTKKVDKLEGKSGI
jgi:hypothetical protein